MGNEKGEENKIWMVDIEGQLENWEINGQKLEIWLDQLLYCKFAMWGRRQLPHSLHKKLV